MLMEQVVIDCIKQIELQTAVKPYIIGITGSPGAGKTTLSNSLKTVISSKGINCLILCIDDFYLSKLQRIKLSRDVHPLCLTRGVPGTHNINLLDKTLSMLSKPSSYTELLLPVFSKSDDDILDKSEWLVYKDKPDIIIFEGWCLGARPDFIGLDYVNNLERFKDKEAIWKKWTIKNCKNYLKLWAYYDKLIMIKPSNFESVIKSRWNQENDIFKLTGMRLFKSHSDIVNFCSYYESWTHGMWNNLSHEVDILLTRDDNYNYTYSHRNINNNINRRVRENFKK
jgi:D-glycerate 3-kinase